MQVLFQWNDLNHSLNNPALDIRDCSDLIMYHDWYTIGFIVRDTMERILLSLTLYHSSESLLKSPKIVLNHLKSPPKSQCFFCQFCLSHLIWS